MIEMTILGILKTAGIVILSLVVFVVAFVLVLLLLPVFYKLNIDSNKALLCLKFRLLLGMISIGVSSEDDFNVRIRLFGIAVKKLNFNKDNEENNDLKEEEGIFISKVKLDNEMKADGDSIDEMDSDNESDSVFSKFYARLRKIKGMFSNLFSVIKNFINNFKKIVSMLNDESIKRAFSSNKLRLIKLIKHLSPKKSDLRLCFGLENPADTGFLLAMISPFYYLYGPWLKIEALFDENQFYLSGCAGGNISLAFLLWHFLHIYFDKDIRSLKKNLNNF